MKKAKDNAKLKRLIERINQLCALNGVSLSYDGDPDGPGGGQFVFVEYNKRWENVLKEADDDTHGKEKSQEVAEAAEKGSGFPPAVY